MTNLQKGFLFILTLTSFFALSVTHNLVLFVICSTILLLRSIYFVYAGVNPLVKIKNKELQSNVAKIDILRLIIGLLIIVCLAIIYILRKDSLY